MAGIAAELGLGVAFALMFLAPSLDQSQNDSPKIRVQIKVGLESADGDEYEREEVYKNLNMGGAVPNVVLFNANGDRIAYHRNEGGNEKMEHNAPHDIFAEYFDQGSTQTPEYISVTASGSDAVCITSVSVTPPNTKEMWAFLPGEIAAECAGQGKTWPWFYSQASITVKSEDGFTEENVRPRCLWIDRSSEEQAASVPFEGFSAHLPDFKVDNSKWEEWENDLFQMCASGARFEVYEHMNEKQCPQILTPPPEISGVGIPYDERPACHPDRFHGQPQEDPALDAEQAERVNCMFDDCQEETTPDMIVTPINNKRSHQFGSLSRRRQKQKRWVGQMIWSQDETASAVDLCNDPGSRGPDFFSESEQKFCDMDTHKIFPVCSSEEVECFDPYQNITLHGGVNRRGLKRRYTNVKHWERLNAL
ncbi:hypothetical protein K458DRAFT_484129 [Lentithecium fluviatile CBS 122367]|uniref:Uncharacterized protein n=1 Tax=Lentithecium fluviatile CBS 122367 TaxID=1168545 RepID=A0A6G1JG33_9PLEO|nr:hypothetical protein K458DRAFT_484129 [Lentithecium fluviatile CBS 122367]